MRLRRGRRTYTETSTYMATLEPIRATVVYALPERQWAVSVELESGASVKTAIDRSGLLEELPELRARVLEVGVCHRRCSLEAQVQDGDCIEIYRPLQIDPKEARRLRGSGKQVAARARPGQD